MMKNLITKFLQKKSVRVALLVLAIFWTVFATLFYVSYKAAFVHLHANDPRIMQNRSELQVFYAPLSIAVGDQISAKELTTYFDELGYENRADATIGSYSINKNTVDFVPRSAIFQPAILSFENNRLGKISVNNSYFAQNKLSSE